METPITHAEFNDRMDKLERRLDERMQRWGRSIAHEVVLEHAANVEAVWDKRFEELKARVDTHDRYIDTRRKVETAAVQVATNLIKIPVGVIGGKAAAAIIATTLAALSGLIAKLFSLLGGM